MALRRSGEAEIERGSWGIGLCRPVHAVAASERYVAFWAGEGLAAEDVHTDKAQVRDGLLGIELVGRDAITRAAGTLLPRRAIQLVHVPDSTEQQANLT